jgi:hypothetical protein
MAMQLFIGEAAGTWCSGYHVLPQRIPKVTRGGVMPQAVNTYNGTAKSWVLGADPGKQVSKPARWVQTSTPGFGLIVKVSASGSKANGSRVRTQFSWVQRIDSILLGPPSKPNSLGSSVITQFS